MHFIFLVISCYLPEHRGSLGYQSPVLRQVKEVAFCEWSHDTLTTECTEEFLDDKTRPWVNVSGKHWTAESINIYLWKINK